MVKLNKTTEYALIALSYIREKKEGELTSAREIAKEFNLPFEILAKTLQKLKENKIIESTYGTRGGYLLNADLNKISLLEFLKIMEGPVGVVGCMNGSQIQNHQKENGPCEFHSGCQIKPMMSILNNKIYEFLGRITLAELTSVPIKNSNSANFLQQTSLSPNFEVVLSGEEP